jgi:hypothetical protein
VSGSGRRNIRSRISERLPRRHRARDPWDDYAQDDQDWDNGGWPAADPGGSGSRARDRTAARPLSGRQPVVRSASGRQAAMRTSARHAVPLAGPMWENRPLPAVLPTDSVPDLMAYHPERRGLLARAPVRTRAIIQGAKSRPWMVARLLVALVTLIVRVGVSLSAAGEPPQPAFAFKTSAGSGSARPIVEDVQPLTQLIRCDQYDSNQQCQDYGGASCSAAVQAEIYTAWGLPKMTIGRMIDELGPDISPWGGLLTHEGFKRVAAKHGFRADLSTNLSYDQILYIVNNLGIPLIVNVRQSYGYYHYFSGGHFLVATGGNAQGLRIVDSSEYYIHYLPKDVFYSMFTGRTALLIPQDYQYSLPKS